MNVLIITTEWPTSQDPFRVPFLVSQVKWFQAHGISVDVFYFEGKKKLFNYIKAFFRLRKLLQVKSYQILHAQWGQSALPALMQRKALVITYRGSDLQGIVTSGGNYTFKGKILQTISKVVAYRAKSIIVVSEQLKRRLPSKTLHKVRVIPTGIDLSLFQPLNREICKAQLSLRKDTVYILFGGNPTRPEKRFFLAQQALTLVQRKIKAEILITQNVAREEMPVYLGASHGVLLTSIHEGSPNIVKEALACNRAVVSVDVGDVKERITGLPGCFVVSAKPEALAEAILLSINQRQITTRHSVLPLDENLLNKQILDVYEMLI